MKMFSFGSRKFISIFVLFAIVAQIGLFSYPQKVSAVLVVPTIDAANLSVNTAKLAKYAVKEFTLDSIAYLLAKTLIRQMTTSVVNWINSGFQGSPSFVTNPAQFFLDTGDQIAGRFIEGSELGFLCDPFRLDIRLALGLQYSPFQQKITCTLSEVFQNARDAGKNFAESGGWDNWLQITTRPQNNVYGAYLVANAELNSRILEKVGIETKKLEFGRGFFSWEKCKYFEDGGGLEISKSEAEADYAGLGYSEAEKQSAVKANSQCETQTPGSVIEGQINQVLPSGLRQLELADEFNEIINALAVQLVQQAVGGGGGLRGASARSGGNRSLTERLNSVVDIENIANIKKSLNGQINDDIENEISYRNSKQASVDQLRSVQQAIGQLIACYQDKINRNNNTNSFFNDQTLTAGEREVAVGRISLASTTIVTRIEPEKSRLNTDLQKANSTIGILNSLKGRVSAVSTISAIQEVSTAYQTLGDTVTLHRIDETIEAQGENTRISGETATLFQETSQKIEECLRFPPRNQPF